MRADEDFEIEITDLDESDTDSRIPVVQFVPALTDWRRFPHRRRYWRAASAMCILLLLGIVFNLSNGFFSTFAATIHTALSANTNLNALSLTDFHTAPPPQQDGIMCLTDAAWSPNGKTIAVLGYRQDCAQGDYLFCRQKAPRF